MGKNKDMLNIYLRVLQNDKEAIQFVTPNSYQQDIFTIDYQKLKKLGYKNLIFDIDNTITAVNSKEVPKQTEELFDKLKKDFKLCILSNNNEKRVEPIKKKLNILSLAKANKPKLESFTKVLEIINGKKEDTVIIGDQMLSDIVGGNRYGLYTILVEPYQKQFDLKTGVSRILQNKMMKKLNTINRYNYY